jgi:hypothetical protein
MRGRPWRAPATTAVTTCPTGCISMPGEHHLVRCGVYLFRVFVVVRSLLSDLKPRCYELSRRILCSAHPRFACTITPACVLYAAVLTLSPLCWCSSVACVANKAPTLTVSLLCNCNVPCSRYHTRKRATCRHADCLTAGLHCDVYHQGQRSIVRRSEAGGAAAVPRIES